MARSPRRAAADGHLGREHRLADAGGAHDQGTGARVEPAAQQQVDLRVAAGDDRLHLDLRVLRGDEAGVDGESAGLDGEVVVAAAEPLAAQLGHPRPAPLGSVLQGELLEQHHPVHDAGEVQVAVLAPHVVQQEHGAARGR